VNGKLVPLRYRLQSGDTVEIITTPQQTPSKDWLKIVKTPRASSKIRLWIKAQQRTRSVDLGREILERDLGRYKLELSRLRKESKLEGVLRELGAKDEDSLLAAIGYGRITAHQVISKILPPEQMKDQAQRPEGALRKLFRLVARQQPQSGVRVSGVEDVLVRFGRCCNPLPGERIAGFITRGRGVTIHSASCARVMESDPARKVDVVWDGAPMPPRQIKVEVVCVDQPGMLASISKVISSSGINIARAEVRTTGDEAVSTFNIMVKTADDLNRVMRNIGKLRGVLRVNRGGA
jgi:GTP pyrophosphokinase